MRVMGVDPGLTRCGLSIVDAHGPRKLSAVEIAVVRTPASDELGDRLLAIDEIINQWLDLYSPDVIAVERVFSQRNISTAMNTAQVGGIVAMAGAKHKIPVHFHTPTEVKAAVCGFGQADKQQVTTMVTKLLRLAQAPRPADAADALALAICHALKAPALQRVQRAKHDTFVSAEARMRRTQPRKVTRS